MKRKKPKTCECVECLMAEPCGAPATNAKDRVVALCTDCAGPRRTWAKYDTGSELDELWDITCAKRNRPKKPESSPVPVRLYAVGRRCERCFTAWVTERVVLDGCTLPCQAIGCTSPHPRPCFCDTCRPTTPRREWRPAW